MERLASEILKDLTLYKQCHHCKRVNLASNPTCYNCSFPELDNLTESTIKIIKQLSYIGETIQITSITSSKVVNKSKSLFETIKSYVCSYPRLNTEYFTREEVDSLLDEYKKVDSIDFWMLLNIITDSLLDCDTVLVEDVYTTVICILENKKEEKNE